MNSSPAALVLGTGVVGCATAATLSRQGFSVYGHDPDPDALADFPGQVLPDNAPYPDWSLIAICVPTPTLGGAMSPRALLDALDRATRCLDPARGFTVIAVRSTVVPGTMDSIVRGSLREVMSSGRAGLCYWPSFARERVALDDEASPRAVVFGTDGSPAVHELMARCASGGSAVSFVSFAETELIKHGANLFNALKISYFNAIGDWAAERGGDAQAVADAIATVAEGCWNPAYGTAVGPPFAGACLPKDLDAFATRLAEDGSPHRGLLGIVRDINEAHSRHVPPAK